MDIQSFLPCVDVTTDVIFIAFPADVRRRVQAFIISVEQCDLFYEENNNFLPNTCFLLSLWTTFVSDVRPEIGGHPRKRSTVKMDALNFPVLRTESSEFTLLFSKNAWPLHRFEVSNVLVSVQQQLTSVLRSIIVCAVGSDSFITPDIQQKLICSPFFFHVECLPSHLNCVPDQSEHCGYSNGNETIFFSSNFGNDRRLFSDI